MNSKRISYFPFILLIFFLFFVLSFSKTSVQEIRNCCIASVSPFWGQCNGFRLFATKRFKKREKKDDKIQIEKANITLENTLLKNQIDGVYDWLMFDQRIDDQTERMKEILSYNKSNKKKCFDEIYWKDFFRRRGEELRKILEIELQALPAKVVFREPSSWSSSIWINIGKKHNEMLGRLIIGKNSPVLVKDALLGVVEHVGEKKSRVRLITDSGFTPAVRAVRGSSQDRALFQMASDFLTHIDSRKKLFEKKEEQQNFSMLLMKLIKNLQKEGVDYYLAKGELHGSSLPIWRCYNQKLKGVGFNYDYEDKEGKPRDLKTGRSLDKSFDFLSQSLLKKGDLLVTSGMDSVLPAGIKVATISKVKDLEEGAYSYAIEAVPLAFNKISDLNIVFVMPPLIFEEN